VSLAKSAFPHFVFQKTDSGTATKAYEHQPRFVDRQEKKTQQQKTQCHNDSLPCPPLKSRMLRREYAGQYPGQHEDRQSLSHPPVVENANIHGRAKIQPSGLKISALHLCWFLRKGFLPLHPLLKKRTIVFLSSGQDAKKGEMSEWFKERAWKVRIRQKRIQGSNPCLSAFWFLLDRQAYGNAAFLS
jgi:hypothetical protein